MDTTRVIESLIRKLDADSKTLLAPMPHDDRVFEEEVLPPPHAPTEGLEDVLSFTQGLYHQAASRHVQAFRLWSRHNMERVMMLAYTARIHGLRIETLAEFRGHAETRVLGGATD